MSLPSAGARLRETALQVQQEVLTQELYNLFSWEKNKEEILPELEREAARGSLWWETTLSWDEHTDPHCLWQAWKTHRDTLQGEYSAQDLSMTVSMQRNEQGVVTMHVKIEWR